MTDKILRLPEILDRTGLSRSRAYDLMKQNRFPQPVKLGPRASGWFQSEINIWLESLKEARDEREGSNEQRS